MLPSHEKKHFGSSPLKAVDQQTLAKIPVPAGQAPGKLHFRVQLGVCTAIKCFSFLLLSQYESPFTSTALKPFVSLKHFNWCFPRNVSEHVEPAYPLFVHLYSAVTPHILICFTSSKWIGKIPPFNISLYVGFLFLPLNNSLFQAANMLIAVTVTRKAPAWESSFQLTGLRYLH